MWVALTAIISAPIKYKTSAEKWLEKYTTLSAGHTGRRAGCATNREHIRVTVRANHILMGKERIEIKASQVTSDVLSSGIVSTKLHNTGFQAYILML